MPGTAGPRLGLVWGYSPHETGWGVGGFNPNFALLEALVHLTIISITATPPGSPANGDCYIVGASATGAWAGHDKAVAVYYTSGGWRFITPVVGIRAFNRATTSYYRYDGSAWIAEVSATADLSGPGSAADNNVAVFDGITGKVVKDGGQPLPTSFLVGITDNQALENKIIDGSVNDLIVYLPTQVVGNLPVANLGGGTGASNTTAWFGDGTWKPVATGGGGASVTISDTPPVSSSAGDLWFDSSTGQLFVQYDDGTSAQWVIAVNQSGAAGPAWTVSTGLTLSATVLSLTTPVAIANGGTNSTSAPAALTALGAFPAVGGTISGNLTVSSGGDSTKIIASAGNWCRLIYEVTSGRKWSAGIVGTDYAVSDETAGTARLKIDAAGACTNLTGTWSTISETSLKQDIAPYTTGLQELLELSPVQFRYRPGTPFTALDEPSPLRFGLLAEDVEPHIPEIVGETTGTVNGEEMPLKCLNNGDLIFALVNAVKTLEARIRELESNSPEAA